MKRIVILSLLILVLVEPVGAAETSALERGIYWYKNRARNSEGAIARPEPINKAISNLELALEQSGDTKQVAKYLLYSLYFKGTHVPLSGEEKQEVFARGKKVGERMIEKYPESVPVLHGYLINLGRWAEVYGLVSAAREGVAGTMRKYSNKIVDLNPSYLEGAGDRLRGIVYHKTPYIPFVLSWPSNQKALDYLKNALDIGPNHPGNHYHYAVVLYAVGQEKKALKHLEKVLSMEPRKKVLLEDRRLMKKAKKLKKKIISSQ